MRSMYLEGKRNTVVSLVREKFRHGKSGHSAARHSNLFKNAQKKVSIRKLPLSQCTGIKHTFNNRRENIAQTTKLEG